MFNAPVIFTNIPDIAKIYEINDKQEAELEEASDTLEKNIFLDTMNLEMIKQWEEMLKIIPQDNDTVQDRRFRVKSKVMERLPYSVRILRNKLETLCPQGYHMEISDNRTSVTVKLALTSKKMMREVGNLLEEILPLNMVYEIQILWNQYSVLKNLTYNQMKPYTYQQLREEVFG